MIVDITDEKIRSYNKMLVILEAQNIEELSVKLDKLKYKVYLRIRIKD